MKLVKTLFSSNAALAFSVFFVASMMFVNPSFAQTDYDTIVTAVDWSDVITNIAIVFAAISGVLVFFKGGKIVLKAIRGA